MENMLKCNLYTLQIAFESLSIQIIFPPLLHEKEIVNSYRDLNRI